MLRLEGVLLEEQKEVMSVFLESMQETQVELSDHENGLFVTLLEMLEESRRGVFSAGEIASRIEHDGVLSEKALQTWVGNVIKQMGIYTEAVGRKGNKKTYLFTYDRVRDIFNRYTLKTGGRGGKVALSQQNQGIPDCHLKNIGGTEVAGGSGNDETKMPPMAFLPPPATYQKQVAESESLTVKEDTRGVPPMPPKTVVNENKIFTGGSVENLDIENLSYEEVVI